MCSPRKSDENIFDFNIFMNQNKRRLGLHKTWSDR